MPVWGHFPKTSADRTEHRILRMLRSISNDTTACFLKITFSQISLRTFQHVTAARYCVRILTAHQQDSFKDILQCYSSSSQTRTHSVGAQKLHTVIPKRRADDYCFQTATSSIWNALPNEITSIASKRILMSIKLMSFIVQSFKRIFSLQF